MAKHESTRGQPIFDAFGSVPNMPDGYYAGDQPNRNLRSFVETHGTIYDQASDDYNIPAFHEAITLSRATAIYHMHTYWSKKPYDAIRQYINHYVAKGGIV